MKKMYAAMSFFFLFSCLSACGQSGKLYLPNHQQRVHAATQ